jgi:hypothetical protein
MNAVLCVVVLILMVWYINTYIVNGTDKQLIFVKIISLILVIITVAMVLFKIVSPNQSNNVNVMSVFDLIKDVTFIIIGYLFTKKEDNENR